MRGGGKANVYAMLACPIGHTKSPGMLNRLMEPRETRLLKYARSLGCRAQYGQPTMDCQMKAMGEFLRAMEGPKRND